MGGWRVRNGRGTSGLRLRMHGAAAMAAAAVRCAMPRRGGNSDGQGCPEQATVHTTKCEGV